MDSQLFFGPEPLITKLTKYGGTVFLKFDIFTGIRNLKNVLSVVYYMLIMQICLPRFFLVKRINSFIKKTSRQFFLTFTKIYTNCGKIQGSNPLPLKIKSFCSFSNSPYKTEYWYETHFSISLPIDLSKSENLDIFLQYEL